MEPGELQTEPAVSDYRVRPLGTAGKSYGKLTVSDNRVSTLGTVRVEHGESCLEPRDMSDTAGQEPEPGDHPRPTSECAHESGGQSIPPKGEPGHVVPEPGTSTKTAKSNSFITTSEMQNRTSSTQEESEERKQTIYEINGN